jgi:hypothetical protein
MSFLRLILCFSWVGLAAWPAGAATAVPPAGDAKAAAAKESSKKTMAERFRQNQATRFKEIDERLTVLFRYRSGAKPDLSSNPFRAPGTAPAPGATTTTATTTPADSGTKPKDASDAGPAPNANLALLQQAAATLRVTGNLATGGQSRLVINGHNYREGDMVPTQVANETIYLRVKEIARRSVTLELDGAEMTLKF